MSAVPPTRREGTPPTRSAWKRGTFSHPRQRLARPDPAADTTVRGYLDILEATFMVRLLRPWHENVGK
jgi:hypothetical protein